MAISKVASSHVTPTQPRSAEPLKPQAASTPQTSSGWVPKAQSQAPQAAKNGYGLTTMPAASDWNFEGTVRELQKPEHIPARARAKIDNATDAQLRRGVSSSWTQEVTHAGKTETMTVELTRKLIPVPYETFIAKVPPSQWGGPNLARYLGGEVQPVAYDAQGRPTKQLERMVLAQDDLAPLLPPLMRGIAGKFANDMTKAETITYGENSARVDWRVYGSDNGSTLADLGSVTFEKAPGGTMVTFHSAHQLGVPGSDCLPTGPIALPPALVGLPLENAFLAHADHYAQVVQ